MARQIMKALLSAGAAISPDYLKFLAQKKYYGLSKNVKIKKLREYAQVGIHPGGSTFKILHSAGLIDDLDFDLINTTRHYHSRTLGRHLDPVVNVACKNLHNISDSRFLPWSFYYFHLVPYLNDMTQHDAYTDKNLYTKHLPSANQPSTILKNINGSYFDLDDKPIKPCLVASYVRALDGEFIIKPSRTANGKNIKLMICDEGQFLLPEKREWKEIVNLYGKDFLVQKRVVQHEVMAEPHSSSVNTMRILTLRWGGDVHFLLAFARFGNNGTINDNAGTGGVCVGIDKDGRFSKFAVNAQAQRLNAHPSSGYLFSQQKKIPGFDKAVNLCLELHNEVLHHNFISWDIAIDPLANPVFIEHNFRGALWLYQLATGEPVLGDFTDEILFAMRDIGL